MWRARQACQLRCIANRAGRLCNPAIAPSKQGVTKGWDKFLSVSWYPHPSRTNTTRNPNQKPGPTNCILNSPKSCFALGVLGSTSANHLRRVEADITECFVVKSRCFLKKMVYQYEWWRKTSGTEGTHRYSGWGSTTVGLSVRFNGKVLYAN